VKDVKPKVRKTSQQTSSTDVKKKKMKDKSKKVTKCGKFPVMALFISCGAGS